MKQLLLLLSFCFLTVVTAQSQSLSGTEVIDRSLDYHDPKGKWDRFRGSFDIETSQGDMAYHFDLNRGFVSFLRPLEGGHQSYQGYQGNDCFVELDGSTDISDAQRKELKLTCPDVISHANYTLYMQGIPMKLQDAGIHISEKAEKDSYKGTEYWRVDVKYDPKVGKDEWKFYFDMETYALKVARLYIDGWQEDHEIIEFGEPIKYKGIKFPGRRTWYLASTEKEIGYEAVRGIGKFTGRIPE